MWPRHCYYSSLGNLAFLVILSVCNNLRCHLELHNPYVDWTELHCLFPNTYIPWICYLDEQELLRYWKILLNLSFLLHLTDLTALQLFLLKVFLLQFMIKPFIFILYLILTASLQRHHTFIKKKKMFHWKHWRKPWFSERLLTIS